MAAAPSPSNPYQAASALAAELNVPQSASNLNFLSGWAIREGGNWQNSAKYNAWNTTATSSIFPQLAPSVNYSTNQPGPGVQSYSSWQQGIQATALTLKAYPDIMAALQSGNAQQQNDAGQLGNGLMTWSNGGYSSVPSSDEANGAALAAQGAGASSSTAWAASAAGNASDTSWTKYLNPLNVAKAGASDVGGAAGKAAAAAAQPVIGVVERIVLAVLGVIFVLVGLILAARANGNSAALPAAPNTQPAPTLPLQDAPAPEAATDDGPTAEDDLAAAHAEGFAKGQRAGPNKPLRPRVNKGAGSRFDEVGEDAGDAAVLA